MYDSEIIEQPPIQQNFQIWDNSKRAKRLIIVFWILIGLNVIAIFLGFLEIQLLQDAQNGFFISDSEASISDLRKGIIGLLQMGFYAASVVFFISWFRRAYGNLHRLGISTNHKESIALWAWFIPFVSLFWSYRIMKEIWTDTRTKILITVISYAQIMRMGGRYFIAYGPVLFGFLLASIGKLKMNR